MSVVDNVTSFTCKLLKPLDVINHSLLWFMTGAADATDYCTAR